MLCSLLFIRNCVGHHLASGRPGGPTTDYRRELSRRASRDKNTDRFRRPEFLVTLFSANGDFFILRCELCSFRSFGCGVMPNRNASILEKILPRLFFA